MFGLMVMSKDWGLRVMLVLIGVLVIQTVIAANQQPLMNYYTILMENMLR